MIYIMDSPVILNDELFFFEEDKKYATTYRVYLELKDFRSKSLADNAIKYSFLHVMEPSESSLAKAVLVAKKFGIRLSDADFSIAALALDLKEKKEEVLVITDDFSVQNLLLKLQIPFKSVIRGEIKRFRKFSK